MAKTDWNPNRYERFADVRLQPALDLLGAVGTLPEGDIIDLGCGTGAIGATLKTRFPGRRLIGVDSSTAMLSRAADTGYFDDLIEADIALWAPRNPPALIFSNAALQWLGSHSELLCRLAKTVMAPSGTLAVQMPHQNDAPSHRGWRDAFASLFPGHKVAKSPEVHRPEWYHETLASSGNVRVWETIFYQTLQTSVKGHPVRRFTESTYGKPFLDACNEAEKSALISTYEAFMDEAYPVAADGSVLFPFKRLFFIYTI